MENLKSEEFDELINLLNSIEEILNCLLDHEIFIAIGNFTQDFFDNELAIKKERNECRAKLEKIKKLKTFHFNDEITEYHIKDFYLIKTWTYEELLGHTSEGKSPLYLLKKYFDFSYFIKTKYPPSFTSIREKIKNINAIIIKQNSTNKTSFFADIESSEDKMRKLRLSVWNALLLEIETIFRQQTKGCYHIKFESGREEYKGVFNDPTKCIKSLVDIQKELYKRNQSSSPEEKILLRMGVSEGLIPIIYKVPYYGVNILDSARICKFAKGGQILVTEPTIRSIKKMDPDIEKKLKIQFKMYNKPVVYRGIERIVYEVIWSP